MQQVRLKRDNELDFRSREAYKTLRTNLELCGQDIKVIAFTSCTPNEGKSSVCMNLAYTIADSGKKVIMIDADLRKSVMVGRFHVGKVKYGLSNLIAGQAAMNDTMCTTDNPNLMMMFAGPVPPNPSEMLGGTRFAELIEKLRTCFDYIIIDTPPLGSVIDAAVVSKLCDGIVMVIESNAISYRFVEMSFG